MNLIELGEGVHECTTLCGGLPAVFNPEKDGERCLPWSHNGWSSCCPTDE